jgi:hypothetical protein
VAVGVATVWTWPYADLSHDYSARQLGESILNTVEPGTLLLGDWTTIPVVQYLQIIEGQRPDVFTINRTFISSENIAILVNQQANLRQIYMETPPFAGRYVQFAKAQVIP